MSLPFPGYTLDPTLLPPGSQRGVIRFFLHAGSLIILRLIPGGHLLTRFFCPHRSLFLLPPTPALYNQPPLHLTTTTTTGSLSLSLYHDSSLKMYIVDSIPAVPILRVAESASVAVFVSTALY